MASEAIPAAVRQFQSEIDAIRHEEEPLSVRATVLVLGAACLVLALILIIARVDRVVSSTGGKIVSVDAPLVLQALDPSIVKSIDVREGEVVEKDRLLATLDPTFALADVRQLQEQIDSLNAQITREEAELAHKSHTPQVKLAGKMIHDSTYIGREPRVIERRRQLVCLTTIPHIHADNVETRAPRTRRDALHIPGVR